MKKRFLILSLAFAFCTIVNAQDGPGGLGTGTGDAGNGDGSNGVSDVSGGSGTTGGNQGTEAPIDGGVAILFASGAIYTAVKLSGSRAAYVHSLV